MGILLDVMSPAGAMIMGLGFIIAFIVIPLATIFAIICIAKEIRKNNMKREAEAAEARRALRAKESIRRVDIKDKD